jgi:hypothetical protein
MSPDAYKAYQAAYRAKNRDAIRAHAAAYRAANRNSVLEREATYRAKNRESMRMISRAHGAKNRSELRPGYVRQILAMQCSVQGVEFPDSLIKLKTRLLNLKRYVRKNLQRTAV